ncbi:MAG: outer membrane protein assembly factor BamD [Pyrinomonadaceae bacterium]
MRFRYLNLIAVFVCAVFLATPSVAVFGVQAQQQGQPRAAQSEGTPTQRLEVLRQRLEGQRRTLNSTLAGLNTGDDKEKKDNKSSSAEDAATRLRGLEKEIGSLLSEVLDLRGKADRAEKFEASDIDKLESAAVDLNGRIDTALLATAGERRTAAVGTPVKKKKTGFFGRLLGRGGDDEFDELISNVGPGRDRALFAEASRQACKSNYEGARILFNLIISTYPDSPYLPHAKLAIADTFYLEGTTSALIQAAAAYQEWLTFFPTDPLADEAMLKVAESEMRKMGLSDRDTTPARKAEQRIKAALQQFPDTSLRPDFEVRLREVQELLAMHSFQVGNFYLDRWQRGVASNPKGAQSRYREVIEKYPHFSRRDAALYDLAVTYIAEEEPDEAAKHLTEIVRFFPNGDYAEKAKEQLEVIGAPVPEPDAEALKRLPPERPSMTSRLLTQIVGTTPTTIDKNGVLINKDCDKGPALIDLALQNNGQLPVTTPTAPVSSRRIPPARSAATTEPAQPKSNDGVQPQPTRPGPPATGNNPTVPPPSDAKP